MEEIGTFMRFWKSSGDLPLVIGIVVSFRSFRCAPLAKRHKISITRGRSPGLSQEQEQKKLKVKYLLINWFYRLLVCKERNLVL
jgi:hypothetical protein